MRARGSRKPDERGATMVEAAIVLPVVMLIVFGIIEFGLAFKDALTVSSAVRAGARTASAEPRQATFNDDTAKAVERAVSALPNGAVEQLWVYKADGNGNPVDGGGSAFTSCNTCAVYTWDTVTSKFVRQAGPDWNPSTHNACVGDASHDAVGIYLKVNHDFVTGFFGQRIKLVDHAVMNLEPVPVSQGCK
jgi:Flp pilus assembly protein TadG